MLHLPIVDSMSELSRAKRQGYELSFTFRNALLIIVNAC